MNRSTLLSRLSQGFKQYQAVLIVITAGLILLLIPTGRQNQRQERELDVQEEGVFDVGELENKLSDALSKIDGAGEVEVILTLKTSGRQVLAEDTQRDGERNSTQVVTIGGVSAQQEVVTVETIFPEFQGALVICSGGGDPEVRFQITAAISALTGLGSDKITICKST